jgi:phenylalanyl-tRNA synthetase alpha chain
MSDPDQLALDQQQALERFRNALGAARSDADLKRLRAEWLGRKDGWVTTWMAQIATAPGPLKRAIGQLANEAKRHIEDALAEREAALAATRRPAGAVDITLAGRTPLLGHRHPLSLVREQVQDIFTRLGYQVLEGPEVEDDYHNFEALNMPAEHPARDMQDTLYLATPLPPPAGTGVDFGDGGRRGSAPDAVSLHKSRGRLGTGVGFGDGGRGPQPLTLLRTHTSAMQIRHMEQNDPPVRIISIGPVYRRDNLDLTHTPMFHQCEGLVVGPNITLADLKGTLISMAKALFGPNQDVRFRPSFFPYTEPSAEVDIRCIRCQGAGCSICKRTGWLEILGSGMVHPAVFEAVGYDPDEVSGFAFGMGIERVAMLKWDVDDIRLFYDNDMRFLEQFGVGPSGVEGL